MAERTSGKGEFRKYLPDLSTKRFTVMKTQDAHEYTKDFKELHNPPWLYGLYELWRKLLQEPFRGVTNDGVARYNLYKIQDEGLPIEDIVSATNKTLSLATPDQRTALTYHIDSPEWRSWSNPEFLLSNKGVRLDEITADLRSSILHILEVTLSPAGFAKATAAMKINHFLGELVQCPRVMNEHSYNFALFGTPSTTQPWGFSFYGHHLVLNIFLVGRQVIMAPCFTGAEPNEIDTEGVHVQIMNDEEKFGLELMQSLPQELQKRAQIYEQLKDPKMPHGRWNHDDQRHLCGAYRDNRVVPYEGITVMEMPEPQRDIVLSILKSFLAYLPAKSLEAKIHQIHHHLKETYFCWIGGFGDEDAFYYRIQSPVVLIEFDHHSGVFLTNSEPAKFHIHTVVRFPNGGDYGHALRPLAESMKQEYVWEG